MSPESEPPARRRSASSRGGFGWADDIVAPRQEINTLSLLYEEAAIQQRLDDAELTPSAFLEVHRESREAYRSEVRQLAPSLEETIRLTERVALFGEQAGARARLPRRERAMLSCIAPDRPGVLATLAEAIAEEGGNIEGAVMSIVAGHLVTVFLVSGLDKVPKRAAGKPDLIVDYMQVGAEDIDWPRPGSTCWHTWARGRADTSLLLGLTAEINRLTLPLITMSSWHEPAAGSKGDTVEVVDLNFAIAPGPAGNELRKVRALESGVEERVAESRLDILPVGWPTQHRAEGRVGGTTAMDVVMTVVGHAEPGFVHTVLLTLVEDVGDIIDIRGSSMAILEGMTVFTVVFTRASRSSLSDLEKQVKKQVTHGLTSNHHKMPIPPIQIVEAPGQATLFPSDAELSDSELSGEEQAQEDRHRPTHELSLQVPEQSRVVMKVARLLAEHDVNITWFVSRVHEPNVGQRWPVCDIQMHLNVRPGSYDKVNSDLRTLSGQEGWDEVTIHEWSLGPP